MKSSIKITQKFCIRKSKSMQYVFNKGIWISDYFGIQVIGIRWHLHTNLSLSYLDPFCHLIISSLSNFSQPNRSRSPPPPPKKNPASFLFFNLTKIKRWAPQPTAQADMPANQKGSPPSKTTANFLDFRKFVMPFYAFQLCSFLAHICWAA